MRPTSTPSVPAPGVVIPTAIAKASNAWNNAVVNTAPENVNFCKEGSCSNNTDGKDVKINVEQGHTGYFDRQPLSAVFALSHCGADYACVKPRPPYSGADVFVPALSWLPIIGDKYRMKNLFMVIEEPAWRYDVVRRTHTRYVWTSDPKLHGVALSSVAKAEAGGANSNYTYQWLYVPWLVIHEFGHTAGLTDLYKYDGYSGYLMNDYSTYKAKALVRLKP